MATVQDSTSSRDANDNITGDNDSDEDDVEVLNEVSLNVNVVQICDSADKYAIFNRMFLDKYGLRLHKNHTYLFASPLRSPSPTMI